ncbi:sulfite exporter TauE/SafE family protein [Aquimarina sp. W85]|uniref:sulfite exporter TauE/SafE family protein n=1 Tax=Aquimarina rhodophyticola TaxID=3342246 RepID=UPI00366F40E6
MQEYYMLGLLLIVGCIAGIINTLAGGGSLLTLPILIFMGLPPAIANGTNRIGILIQGVTTVAGFRSKGIRTPDFGIYMGLSALIGSVLGAKIAIDIKGETFNKILAVIMVVVVLFMVFKPKKLGLETVERITGKYFWWSLLAFFFIGIYGGFIQAGIGIFILLVLSSINQINLVKSNAIKSLVVAIYTLAALLVFILNDQINFLYGIILAVGNATGGWFASRWSVKKGDGMVKTFLIIMVIAMAGKLLWDS